MLFHVQWWPALVALLLLSPWNLGCVAQRLTSQIETLEGPRLRCARMSSTLGVAKLSDGRVVVVGGSQLESPFEPIVDSSNARAVEILDKDLKEWRFANLKIPFPISGKVFPLPPSEGLSPNRLLVFGAVYVFSRETQDTTKAGAVSAAILDLDKQTVTPLYRPRNNDPSQAPLQGNGPALLQRAFARTLQLKDGRILRVGGRAIYKSSTYERECKEGKCLYCEGTAGARQCKPHPDHAYACSSINQCPALSAPSKRVVFKEVELYLPPTVSNPLGSLKRWTLAEGRYNLDLQQLLDGRVLFTGGQGPRGDGAHQTYKTSYLFETNLGKEKLVAGPEMVTGREDHSSLLLRDGRVRIIGGTNSEGSTVRSSETFDPDLNLFLSGPQVLVPREDHIPLRVGLWGLFLGGEIDSAADNILNSAEAFHLNTGEYIGNFLLFPLSRSSQTKLSLRDLDVCECERKKLAPEACLQEKQKQLNTQRLTGYAGIDDFAAVVLDDQRVLVLGGQQGKQDPDGKYINSGEGSRRTLLIKLPKIQP